MLRFVKQLSGYRQLECVSKFIQNHIGMSSNIQIGIWIAPRFCCIGSFLFPNKGIPWISWFETFTFSEYAQLHTALVKIVNKRWLRGSPVTLSLATSEIFTVPAEKMENTDEENKDLLPSGIFCDMVENVLLDDDYQVFSSMRHTDIDFWINLCKESGLIAKAVIPSGMWWTRLFEQKNYISFSLPSGTFISRNEDGIWKGSMFIPDTSEKDADDSILTFDAQVRPEYNWCNPLLLPALEAVLLNNHDPLFNLNINTLLAERMIKAEKKFRKCSLIGLIFFAGIITILFTSNIGLKYWHKHLSQKTGYSKIDKISDLKKEEIELKKRILSLQTSIASKNAVTRLLNNAGDIVRDSVWYSEMMITNNNEISTTIIGHSLSEPEISNLLHRADSIDGIKNVRLEYIEKIPADQIKSLTGGLRSMPLFRFKLIFN